MKHARLGLDAIYTVGTQVTKTHSRTSSRDALAATGASSLYTNDASNVLEDVSN